MIGRSPVLIGGLDVTADYQSALGLEDRKDLRDVEEALVDYAHGAYRGHGRSASLVYFRHGSAGYLFDCSDTAQRTVLAVGHPSPPTGERDSVYQRGFPLQYQLAGRPMDRGHFMPFSSGGLFGPNLFVQDRALNRGWSTEGRAYRALETRANGLPESLLSVRPIYNDDTDVPGHLELAVIHVGSRGLELVARRFRNRYDLPPLAGENEIDVLLQGATNGQIGALGEETAALLLEEEFDATIVAMGDAGMPRNERRQDLDLVVIMEGSLVAVEVKTRYNGRLAGRLTRAGRLPAPPLGGGRRPDSPRQGSREYVDARLADVVDVETPDYEGVEFVAAVVDLRAMRAQLFDLSGAGRRTTARTHLLDCRRHVQAAWERIRDHRGRL